MTPGARSERQWRTRAQGADGEPPRLDEDLWRTVACRASDGAIHYAESEPMPSTPAPMKGESSPRAMDRAVQLKLF
jgi:hypothetical protein